jgi:hypothetical protein
MAKHATIDGYIAAMPAPLAEVAADARRVIDANLDGADSAIKWAHPMWSLGKQPVCYLKAASKHVTFGFWRGASIDDPSGRLESSGEVMAREAAFAAGCGRAAVRRLAAAGARVGACCRLGRWPRSSSSTTR